MASENSFRIALVVVIVLTMIVTVYHRVQAASSGEKISHEDEGYVFATVLRLAGLGLWISTFGYLFFPISFQWTSMPLHSGVRWFGVVVGIGCSVLMYWTLSSLGKNLTDTVVTRVEATLVTHGPYRWVRPSLLRDSGVAHGFRDAADGELADRCNQSAGTQLARHSHAQGGADVDRAIRPAVP